MLDARLQLMWIGWVLVLYTGNFTLNAFSALVSFGSDDLNESLPRRANSQFASSSHGWQTGVEIGESPSLCCCCSDWMLRISSSVRNNLVSFDWSRTEAKHTSRPLIDSYSYLTSTR